MGKIKRFHYLLGKFMVFSTLVNFSASSYKLSKMFKLQIYFLVANLILSSCVDSGTVRPENLKLQTKSKQQNREASLQIKMEELVTGLHTKLDRFESRLQELFLQQQNTLDAQLKTVSYDLNQLKDQINGMQTVNSTTEVGHRKIDPKTNTSREDAATGLRIPPGFEKIGMGYYYIEENDKQDWKTAQATCFEKGGSLAYIQSNETLLAIHEKLREYDGFYWIGINNLKTFKKRSIPDEGSIIPIIPHFIGIKECVALLNLKMITNLCFDKLPFICQSF